VVTVRQRPIGPRSSPRSRGHRHCAGVEALEPVHEERGNNERATVGGADGGGKKQRRRSLEVDMGSSGSGSVQAAWGGSSSGSERR
jgi:hypothetical protein